MVAILRTVAAVAVMAITGAGRLADTLSAKTPTLGSFLPRAGTDLLRSSLIRSARSAHDR